MDRLDSRLFSHYDQFQKENVHEGYFYIFILFALCIFNFYIILLISLFEDTSYVIQWN